MKTIYCTLFVGKNSGMLANLFIKKLVFQKYFLFVDFLYPNTVCNM